MKILAEKLTDYIVREGAIKEDEREIFIYGFQTAFEIFFCIFISCMLSYVLGVVKEGILFSIIFIPLRSYAGGLHLSNYWTCLLLSCLTFVGILVLSKFLNVEALVSFLGILFLLGMVLHLYPVENVNRVIDEKENVHFKMKLKKFVRIDLIISTFFLIFRKDTYLLVILTTLFMIVVTMFIGKYRNLKNKLPFNFNRIPLYFW